MMDDGQKPETIPPRSGHVGYLQSSVSNSHPLCPLCSDQHEVDHRKVLNRRKVWQGVAD